MRKILLATAVALLVFATGSMGDAQASAVPAATSGAVAVASVSSSPKVVIIVGATEGTTPSYRAYADAEYETALKYTPNVVRIYSPDATWAAVQAAVKDAAVVIYHGHGNGWPSPYPYDPYFKTRDGFGLNKVAGQGDSNRAYYGEPYIKTLTFSPGALVLLHNLCYASGDSEPGYPQPTQAVAVQRADNYASAFLAAGASAVIADGHMGAGSYLDALFTQHESLHDLWRSMPDFHNNSIEFPSTRTPGDAGVLDPEHPTSDYYRSIVGNLSATTDDVLSARSTPLTSGAVTRLAGGDRYATAAAVSAAVFGPGVPVAYVATGAGFPDALAGGPAAGDQGGPLLLVAKDSVPPATAAELARLKPARIVVLGGPSVVSDAVASALGLP
jgi:Cell wall binding domain 2 (CWB2)